MQNTRFLFFLLLTFLSVAAKAQFNISGKVIDAETKEPLSGASVYCQNTTSGTTSNKQGEFSLALKSSGGYELIVSFTGYQTHRLQISHTDAHLPDIEMAREEKSMTEVIIKSSNELKDGWERYGSFFVEQFIGTTPNAAQSSFLNNDVLKFYLLKKSNKLRVLATEPLQIENRALGYNMRYQLDSFIYDYNTGISSYSGFCLYSEMEGSDSLKKVWAQARERAYLGSKLHFMRSYYDSTVAQEGFTIDLLDEHKDASFSRITNPYDTLYYGALDSTMQVEIWYPRKISVTYTGQRPDPEYLKQFKLPKNVAVQISYIDIKNSIAIKENGYYYEQRDWVNQGYWSWKNIADQLPLDY
ncbi:MAG: carboxypeptidase-like regulatory domain-containing protein [Chitinophagaceae bacterium]